MLNWMPYGNSMLCVCQVLLHGGTWTEASCAFLAARSCALLAARSYAFHVLLLKPFCCVIALTCESLADKSLAVRHSAMLAYMLFESIGTFVHDINMKA